MRVSWKVWLPLSFLGVVAIGLWVAWNSTGLAAASDAYEARLAKAKAIGIPMTWAEVRKTSAVDPRHNAAPIYVSLIKDFDNRSGPSIKAIADLVDLEQEHGLTKTEWDALAGHLKPLAKPLAQIDVASRTSGFDMNRKWERGWALLLPEFPTFKNMGKTLVARALLRSHQHDPKGALDDIEATIRFAHQVEQEPMMISMLVGMSIENTAVAALSEVCNEHAGDKATLERALKLVNSLRLPDIRRWSGTEFVATREAVRMASADPRILGTIESDQRVQVIRLAAARKAVESIVMRGPLEIYERYPKDPDDYRAAEKVLVETDRLLDADDSLPAAIAGTLATSYGGIVDSLKEQVARRRVSDAAIRLLLARQPGAAFPAKLPFDTEDPFSGKPLLYQAGGASFRVYSVGRDKKDDGGAKPKSDVVWPFGTFQAKPPRRIGYTVPPQGNKHPAHPSPSQKAKTGAPDRAIVR